MRIWRLPRSDFLNIQNLTHEPHHWYTNIRRHKAIALIFQYFIETNSPVFSWAPSSLIDMLGIGSLEGTPPNGPAHLPGFRRDRGQAKVRKK